MADHSGPPMLGCRLYLMSAGQSSDAGVRYGLLSRLPYIAALWMTARMPSYDRHNPTS